MLNRCSSFEGSQPPCDIAILETVYVQDMKLVEGKLHKRFKSSSVKLKKSREWFDLWVWQIWLIYFWMKVYHLKN
ncbi:GIY-YIG nuclease family protein [Nostoc flagelliforme]|uniref:GIY-YIG nuclease family protein n=1 Tax=Nostoc flagelliforme TaxID=1306274 RepID=UPI0012FDE6DF